MYNYTQLLVYLLNTMYGVCQQLLPQPLFFILGDVSKAAPQGSGMCRGRRTADKQDGRLPDQNGSPAIGRQFEHNQIKEIKKKSKIQGKN